MLALLLAVALASAVPAGDRPSAAATPVRKPPKVQAAAAAVMDAPTGRLIYDYRAGRRLPMASTTKIMTARVAMQRLQPQDDVVVPPFTIPWDEMDVGLKPGQVLPAETLLEALLVASAGDAAKALAVAAAGSEKAFVEEMNRQAEDLGLSETHFVNPDGMDAAGHYSSARDLSELGRVEMEDERFARIVGLHSVTVPQQGGGKPLKVETTNTLMLRHRWVDGVKTGYTDKAGFCLVASGDYEGHDMIVTVLGAPDAQTRNRDVLRLFRYGASLYRTWRSPRAGFVVATASVPFGRTTLAIVLSSRYSVSIPPGATVTSDVSTPAAVVPPVADEQELGEVVYKVDGEVRDRRALVAERAVPVADWRSRLRYRLARVWQRGRQALARAVRRVADPRAIFTPAF